MTTRYIALLKGVDMIGKNTITMDQLTDMFARMGFLAVRTVGGSGNILFDAEPQEVLSLTQQIETTIAEATGRKSKAFLRTQAAFQEMVEADPFRDLTETNIKRRVAFLSAPLSVEHLRSLMLQRTTCLRSLPWANKKSIVSDILILQTLGDLGIQPRS